ncbi:MAG TPA: hypothetical protein VGL71_05200 [Urbifossiella sp.]|jgi:hypothetical protein
MSAITLQLKPETERKLRDRAEQSGLTVEALLEEIAKETSEAPPPTIGKPRFISEPKLTDTQFAQWLEDIAAGTPASPLPPDFSRADIYFDHD